MLASGPQGGRRAAGAGRDSTSRPQERMQMTIMDVGPATGRHHHGAAAAEIQQPRGRTKSTMITLANTAC